MPKQKESFVDKCLRFIGLGPKPNPPSYILAKSFNFGTEIIEIHDAKQGDGGVLEIHIPFLEYLRYLPIVQVPEFQRKMWDSDLKSWYATFPLITWKVKNCVQNKTTGQWHQEHDNGSGEPTYKFVTFGSFGDAIYCQSQLEKHANTQVVLFDCCNHKETEKYCKAIEIEVVKRINKEREIEKQEYERNHEKAIEKAELEDRERQEDLFRKGYLKVI